MTAAQVATLNSQLTVARQKLAELTSKRDALVARDSNRNWSETDPAIGSGIRRKPNRKADASRFGKYDRDAAVFRDQQSLERDVRILEGRLAAVIAEAGRVRLTRDDILGATHVRSDAYGWRAVRRVNRVTVSVDSGYSWNDLVPIEKVTHVRTVTA